MIGVATRNKFGKGVLDYTEYKIERHQACATLSGIEGKPQVAHDYSIIPCGIDGDVVRFHCDSIGGSGANCPGLLSNDTFREHKMNLLSAFFQNGDGLLCWKMKCLNGSFKDKFVRVLRTDSGHYLLPMDQLDNWDG